MTGGAGGVTVSKPRNDGKPLRSCCAGSTTDCFAEPGGLCGTSLVTSDGLQDGSFWRFRRTLQVGVIATGPGAGTVAVPGAGTGLYAKVPHRAVCRAGRVGGS